MDAEDVPPDQVDVELEEVEEFFSEKHPEFVLSGLNSLREGGVLCDFTLVSESSSFSLHRALLASCSDYLKALLTSTITDGKQDKVELEGVTVEGVRCLLDMLYASKTEVELEGVTVEGVRCLLDMLYASKTEVNDDNVKQVLGVASCLQIPPIVQACYDFIVEGGSESAKLDHDSGEHSRKILKGLSALRCSGQLCDILLISCKQKFVAHRAVLAACSDYFRAMLTGSLKESKEREIVLHGMKASALEACIDFIYSGQIGLSPQNIGDIINVAAYLQIPTVLELCCTYYKDSITVENCLEITHAAQSYGVTELKEFADDFIVRNFHTFSETEKFETLTQKELIGYLERNSIRASELEVFRFALKWIEADREARVPDACTVMQCVRFPLMSDRDIMDNVQEVGFMMMDPKCHALLVESFTYKAFPYRQNSLQSPQTQVRATDDAVIVIGGETDQAISRELMFCHGGLVSASSRWRNLRPMPSPPRKYHCAAIMDNYLYVVGGTLPGTHLASGFRYDPRFDAWVPIAPMQEARYYFQLVARRGRLYAIAGKLGADILSSVEEYSPELNTWTQVKPLEVEVYGHAACVCEDEVYISGGRVEGHYHDYMVRYDPETGCEQLKPMHDARSGHNMCSVRGDVYVIGGCAVATMERYDRATDSWRFLAPVLSPQTGAGIAVFRDRIYILGGINWNTWKFSSEIQGYDMEANSWSVVGHLPDIYDGLCAGVLVLTQHSRDNGTPR